jgi:hypothetical protein
LVAVRGDDVATQEMRADSSSSLTAAQLLEASGVEPELLNKILSLSLVVSSMHEGEVAYSALDVSVVQAAASLLRGGVDARLLGALRRVVEREVGIIDDMTADLRGSSSTAAEMTSVRLDVAAEIETLRAGLFERALAQYLEL